MKKSIKAHFYNKASPECSYDSEALKPALAFEVHNGITGIAGRYQFPHSQTATGYEMYIRENFYAAVFSCFRNPRESKFKIVQISAVNPALHGQMKKEWRDLKKLNPDLKKVKIDTENPVSLFDSLLGTACLMSARDIGFFVNQREKTQRFDIVKGVNENPDYSALYNQVSAASHEGKISWIPSMYTLKLIKEKLAHKPS